MLLNSNTPVFEILDVMLTIELALLFNPNQNKNSVVRKTCNVLKHRMSKDVKKILHKWATSSSAHTNYTIFMNKVNL